MACETETKVIGDHEISVTQWPATTAMTNKFRLAKTFGATLAIIAAQLNQKGKSTDAEDAEALAKGFSVLFEKNDPEDMVKLIKSFVIGTGCDGERITVTSFEELFSGNTLMEAYKIFIFVIKVNYANLMQGKLADRFLDKIKDKL